MTAARIHAALVPFAVVGIAKLASFAYRPIMARIVPSEDELGQFAIALSAVGLASIIAVMGMQQAIVRYYPDLRRDDDKAALRGLFAWPIVLTLLSSALLAALLWLGRATGGFDIVKGASDSVFASMLWSIPGQALLVLVPYALLAQGHSLLFLVASQLLFNVALITACWLRTFAGPGDVETLLHLYTFSTWLAAAVCLMILVRKLGHSSFHTSCTADPSAGVQALACPVPASEQPEGPLLRLPPRGFFTYAATLMTGTLSYVALGAVDKIMMGWYDVPDADVARYWVANTVAATLPTILIVIDAQLTPKLAAAWSAKDQPAAASAYQSCNNAVLYLASLAVLALVVLREPVMALFGPSFVAATPLLLLMLAIEYFNVISGTTGRMLQLGGRPRVDAAMAGSAMLLNVACNALFIPRLGVHGAILATLLTRLYLSGGKVLLISVYWAIRPWQNRHLVLNTGIAAATLVLLCYYADVAKLWPGL